MKRLALSEAIRAGHPLIGEAHDTYLALCDEDGACGCALGAAYVGVHGVPSIDEWYDMREMDKLCEEDFPLESSITTTCPAPDGYMCFAHTEYNLVELTDHLHGVHEWPRLKIADWLDEQTLTLEPLPAPAHARRATTHE